jgi:transcriptional regulator with XRE-family HTH domain
MRSIFQALGGQIKAARRDRGMTQQALAGRMGRTQARISEFERDLTTARMGRDRLTLSPRYATPRT